ncbi:hypothetical protein GQ457_07G036860 [Hibiscus cannabinus]
MATFMSFVKPASDSPYGRAKHVQLIDKDPNKAVSLFRAAINAGDRVDRALKDSAVVRKLLSRSDEIIEADSLHVHGAMGSRQRLQGLKGRRFRLLRTRENKVSREEDSDYFEQVKTRILGNLAWAYLQQRNYGIAEQHYRKAVSGARKE